MKYYWKVRNFGVEAQRQEQLRGKLFKGRSIRREHTKYKSMRHYVECYVVDNDVVIARSKLIVPIGGYEDAR